MANLLSGSTRAKVALGSFALTVAIWVPSSANSLTNIVASESVMSSGLVQSLTLHYWNLAGAYWRASTS